MIDDVTPFLISPDSSVRDAMACIDKGAKGIALVADSECRLHAIITDGDIRRALLDHADLAAPLQTVIDRQPPKPFPTPLTAPVATPTAELVELMTRNSLRHVPLVDEGGRVTALAVLNDLVADAGLPLNAVVMAGGYGTRLHPLTDETPKPMLPVGDRPLLEHIVASLRDAGIRNVHLTTHYRADQIAEHFGDGSKFGVDIRYVTEHEPLGTAGAIGLLEETDGPLLVMNGDLVTAIDFRAMLEFHDDNYAHMTVAVRPYQIGVALGVVELSGVQVRDVVEKPLLQGFVNAGIYLIGREARLHVPRGERYDMTDLIHGALAGGLRVVGFPLRERWLDIGRIEDYERALAEGAGDA